MHPTQPLRFTAMLHITFKSTFYQPKNQALKYFLAAGGFSLVPYLSKDHLATSQATFLFLLSPQCF